MKFQTIPPLFIRKLFFCFYCFFCLSLSAAHAGNKIVIARNGAGQELMENSLPAIALAAAHNVDIIELPVNITADGELILFKDLTLNRLSDVADIFPGKNREDGGYYVVDFSLAELRQLRLRDFLENDANALSFGIPTLREALSLIRHLEKKLGRQTGISVEIVAPEFYAANGRDISQQTIDILCSFGYPGTAGDRVFLQSLSSDELQRIHNTLLPDRKTVFPLIQLVNEPDDEQTGAVDGVRPAEQGWLFTNIGLRHTASYATAIALPQSLIFSQDGTLLLASYLEGIKKYGLKIFLFKTHSPDSMPVYADNMQALLRYYYTHAEIDGLYADDFSAVQQCNAAIEQEERRRAELPEFFSNLNLSPPAPKENLSPGTETIDVMEQQPENYKWTE